MKCLCSHCENATDLLLHLSRPVTFSDIQDFSPCRSNPTSRYNETCPSQLLLQKKIKDLDLIQGKVIIQYIYLISRQRLWKERYAEKFDVIVFDMIDIHLYFR